MSTAKFKEGDKVIYTNPQGVCWGYRSILKSELWEGDNYKQWRYFLSDSDTPWYPVGEDCLRFKEPNELRLIEVRYSNTDIVHTNMAAHLTDEQMTEYFKIGRSFNVGKGGRDEMATVIAATILI